MEKRVVWVLGAGFSAAVGGPLFKSLFSPSSAADLKIRYPDAAALHDETARVVRQLYAYGCGQPNTLRANGGVQPGEYIWNDPEEFLDYLDTGAGTVRGPHAFRIDATLKVLSERYTPEKLRATARRIMGAECCSFLEGTDVQSERWQPFVAWAHDLGEADTVITFNYDRVVEMCEPPRARVVLPGSESIGMVKRAKCCPILKLHGSVDWEKSLDAKGKTAVRKESPRFVVDGPDDALAIATPGPTKKKTAAEYRDLWTLAKDALSSADAIVFIGYRFPPSDAEARRELLSAISENTVTDLNVHVVLGYRGQDTERLEALLDFACHRERTARVGIASPGKRGTYLIRTHPLFAQDFMTVAERNDLFG